MSEGDTAHLEAYRRRVQGLEELLDVEMAEVTRLREALDEAVRLLRLYDKEYWLKREPGAAAAFLAALAEGSDVLPNQGEEPMDTRTEDLSLTDLIDELKQRRPHGRTAGDVLLLTDAVLALAEKLEEALVSRG